MKVYQPGHRGRNTIIMEPGREFPSSFFLTEDGKPRQCVVTMVNGEAEVDEQLGRYMIDQGLAKASPILLDL